MIDRRERIPRLIIDSKTPEMCRKLIILKDFKESSVTFGVKIDRLSTLRRFLDLDLLTSLTLLKGRSKLAHSLYKRKRALNFFSAFAFAGIELLNLWSDFLEVVNYIDDNATWLLPLLDRVAVNKKAEEK